MKNIKYFLVVMLAVFAYACEQDFMTPPVTSVVQGTPPAWKVQPATGMDVVLFKKNEKETVLNLEWIAATYADKVGVRYLLQIDAKGNNFATPIEMDRISDTKLGVTVGALNTALTKRFSPAQKVEVEMRIKAASNEDLASLYTPVFSMKVTPYLDVPVPSALFIKGTATSVGFETALATLKSGDTFVKYLKLTKDGIFRFADKASEGYQYNFGKFATVSTNLVAAADQDGNFKFTGETGWYEVTADFVNSDLKIAPYVVGTTTYKHNPADVFLVGDYNADVPAWTPDKSPKMTVKKEGVYAIEVKIKDDAILKFVGQPSWGDLDWGNIGADGLDGAIGPKGKNGNIKFNGGDKAYIVTLDLNAGTYEIKEAKSTIYIVGEATSVGWDIANDLEMNFISPNVWAGTFELKAGKEFKFFPEKGSWDNGMGANLFTNFIGCTAVDGGNFKNSGTSDGYYFVIVDLNSKTITVSDSPKILGGSVVAGWTPGDAIAMQMVETGVYDTYQYITVDGSGFKFVPQKSGWEGDLGASKTTAGSLAQTDEDNLSVTKDGFYRVRTKINDFTYMVDETIWGIIGDATPGGWGEDTNMTFTAAKGEYVWKADVTLTNGFIKFRANDDWAINFGDNGANGSLEYGGDNIAVTAGTYHIELILNSATGFKYTITAK